MGECGEENTLPLKEGYSPWDFFCYDEEETFMGLVTVPGSNGKRITGVRVSSGDTISVDITILTTGV